MLTKRIEVPINYPDRTVCVLGLGFVGLTLSTALASVGFNVIGVETKNDVFEKLSGGNAHFFEPGLTEELNRVLKNEQLKVYQKIPTKCRATAYIITVGTPLDENGKINLNSIHHISQDIASVLKDGDMVILRSTVKLGTTRSIVKCILEKTGKKFDLAFCPERTIEGQAMAELFYLPQIIGADSFSASVRAAQLFQFLTPTVIRVSNLETAEMIKLIDNTKRDVMFAFSNEVARLCDVIGLSAEEIINSGRFGYSRTELPMPGPVGGPCLSKDPHILVQSMESYGVVPEITRAARIVNERQPLEIVNFISEFIKNIKNFDSHINIALLGIAFKGNPVTDDIRGTTAKPIFEALKKAFPNASFCGYDPAVEPSVLINFGLIPVMDLQTAVVQSNLVLILNNHSSFNNMPLEEWSFKMKSPAVIYDLWNNFTRRSFRLAPGVQYVALGSHHRPIVGQAITEQNKEYA